MRSFVFLSIVAFSVACEETDKESDGTDLIDDTGSPGIITPDTGVEDTAISNECTARLTDSFPEINNSDFFYRDIIRVTLSSSDDTATLALRKISGSAGDVEGRVEMDTNTLTFSPNMPLEPLNEYIAYVSTCDSEFVQEIPFQTNDFGLPVDAQMKDNTYSFNFGSGGFAPEGLQASLDGMVNNHIMLSVFNQVGSRVTFHSGSSIDTEYVQDFCAVTGSVSSDVDVAQSPDIVVEMAEVPFRSNGFPIALRNFSFAATLSPDGTRMSHGYWTAEAVIREFAPMLNQQAYDMCNNYLPTIDVTCEPCSDGEVFCISMAMTDLELEKGDKSVDCVLADQCHQECPNNSPDCEPKLDECATQE